MFQTTNHIYRYIHMYYIYIYMSEHITTTQFCLAYQSWSLKHVIGPIQSSTWHSKLKWIKKKLYLEIILTNKRWQFKIATKHGHRNNEFPQKKVDLSILFCKRLPDSKSHWNSKYKSYSTIIFLWFSHFSNESRSSTMVWGIGGQQACTGHVVLSGQIPSSIPS